MTTAITLADLAATSLSAVRILEQHGLDYCCGGKLPLEEACLAKGVKPQTIVREIEGANVADPAGSDWQTAPLDELVKHIVGTSVTALLRGLNQAGEISDLHQSVRVTTCGLPFSKDQTATHSIVRCFTSEPLTATAREDSFNLKWRLGGPWE
jgi:Domain of Unknown function (DUF542)